MENTGVLKPGLFWALFLLTLWIPGCDAQYAEVVFDNLYSLVFRQNGMRNFQECLCNSTVSVCILNYATDRMLGEYFYEAKGTESRITSRPSGVYGNITFLCSPGGFTPFDRLACVRLRDSYERCRLQENCLITHVDFFLKVCDSKCINVAWSGYSVSFRNFTQDNLMFQDGTCWDPPPQNDSIISTSTEPALSSSTAEITSSNPNNNEHKDNDTVVIVAAGGWGLLAIIIIIAVISFLIIRKKFRLIKKGQMPSMQNSRVIQNNYTPSNANGLSPQSSYLTSSPAPQAYESPRASVIDGETAEYMDLEDEYTVIEDETLDVTKQSLKAGQNGAIPVLNGHALQAAEEGPGDDGNHIRSEYFMAGDTDSPNSASPHQSALSANQTPDDAEDDGGYNRFENSRSKREPGVTDSFLETYNTSTHSADAEEGIKQEGEVGEATQKKMDVESEDTEMCRDSKGYTTAMKVTSVKAKDSSLKTENSSPTFQTKDMDEDKSADCISESDNEVTHDQSDSLSLNLVNPYDMAQSIST
ncbi:hypothetical protein PoB_001617300 [Plakobranchus ocellatus]|uniref:Uncharacterized protein n=1 Tax=Plakobranchus ocellatus TaxID=259542 RepID=A0AAV3Z4U1_9GAST|nr:hypothetical protein PoB_001617300 [Plakobranchus ocellatus]